MLSLNPLTGQVAIVTGAAAGIGRSVAILLAQAGASVALVDCDTAGLEETCATITEHGGNAATQSVDLSCAEKLAQIVELAASSLGRIDILVNCAGVTGQTNSMLESTESNWDFVFAVNVKAPFLLIKHVGRHMVERGGGGRIVNVTSSSAHRARWSIPAYGASKSALMQLTRSAAADLGLHGINVNAVAPGLTATRIVATNFDAAALEQALREGPASNLLRRVSEPEDIANAVLFLCLPASRQITGQTIHVSAGAVV